MRRFVILIVALSLAATSAVAAPCRDARGRFMKCAIVQPVRCRDAHGRFAKCAPLRTMVRSGGVRGR